MIVIMIMPQVLLLPRTHTSTEFKCIHLLLFRRKHFRQNIVEVLNLYAWLENGLVWWNRLWNGLRYGIYIFHSNAQLYCAAICLL